MKALTKLDMARIYRAADATDDPREFQAALEAIIKARLAMAWEKGWNAGWSDGVADANNHDGLDLPKRRNPWEAKP